MKIWKWKRKKSEYKKGWTQIGTGVHLDHPETIMKLGFPDSFRKNHFWCFGTTRVGKSQFMEHILKGYPQRIFGHLDRITWICRSHKRSAAR